MFTIKMQKASSQKKKCKQSIPKNMASGGFLSLEFAPFSKLTRSCQALVCPMVWPQQQPVSGVP